MKYTYRGNKDFIRRHLYIHRENSRLLNIEAAKQNTDASQILNEALLNYFTYQAEKKN